MERHPLAASTSNDRLDQLLREIVERVERAFPGRVRAYYLSGSSRTGAAQPASDIGEDIVVRRQFADASERKHVKEVAENVGAVWTRDVGA
jgi:hypothetical protein